MYCRVRSALRSGNTRRSLAKYSPTSAAPDARGSPVESSREPAIARLGSRETAYCSTSHNDRVTERLKCTPACSLPGRPQPQSARHAGVSRSERSRTASLINKSRVARGRSRNSKKSGDTSSDFVSTSAIQRRLRRIQFAISTRIFQVVRKSQCW